MSPLPACHVIVITYDVTAYGPAKALYIRRSIQFQIKITRDNAWRLAFNVVHSDINQCGLLIALAASNESTWFTRLTNKLPRTKVKVNRVEPY